MTLTRGKENSVSAQCERKQSHPPWFVCDENSIWLFCTSTLTRTRTTTGNIISLHPPPKVPTLVPAFLVFILHPPITNMPVIKIQEMTYNKNQMETNVIRESVFYFPCCLMVHYLSNFSLFSSSSSATIQIWHKMDLKWCNTNAEK